jgi:hypothetical protein
MNGTICVCQGPRFPGAAMVDRSGGVGALGRFSGVDDPRPGDITFASIEGGFEIRYSDRIATDYPELVDESADWLEDVMGVLNLGQIDHLVLMADGLLTDEVRDGLVAWWETRVEDLV